MKLNTIELLCCPLCKERLKLHIKIKNIEDIIEGSMVCSNCSKEYLIHDGIPRMYIPDNEIVTLSINSRFSKFMITPENLNKWTRNSKKYGKNPIFFTNNIFTRFLVGIGWIFLFISVLSLIPSYFNSAIANNVPFSVFYFFAGLSITSFILDYYRYRESLKIEYYNNIKILKELADRRKLSEYDIRTSTKDKEANFKNDFESQRDFVDHKGKIFAQKLNNLNYKVKMILNIGCGGALHQSVSKPYFDKGYDMIGVDISEEYLKQFNQLFNSDVIQANAMALPFRSKIFDLINFTDIVEHLHNPLFGLSEAQRVLSKGGIIILTTNNHNAITLRCMNPLVFVMKVISLQYDSILPPRNILGQWMDIKFYHTEFSKNEITELLKFAGFEILNIETFTNSDKVNKIFKISPVLKFMCSEFIIIGKKEIPRNI